MYKILVVDDSALMRRVICDIINADSDFRVVDVSADGEDAYNKIKNNPYDLVVLDMVLPKLQGVDLLAKLYNEKIPFNAVLVSSILKEDTESTIRALEYGALDFVVKPIRSGSDTRDVFGRQLVTALHNATKQSSFRQISARRSTSDATKAIEESRRSTLERMENVKKSLQATKSGSSIAQTSSTPARPAAPTPVERKPATAPPPAPAASPGGDKKPTVKPVGTGVRTKKIIALACSTGGPQALHTFVPMLPATLSVPLVLVQHMPEGFTASLAARLDQISAVNVKEAENGEYFKPGWVYITPGGKHMEICEDGSHAAYCHLDDSPPVNSLKPCADVMYRSLSKSSFDEIICVVLTGMGADGSEGIKYLNQYKKTYVISQEASTCVVYGMPKAVEQGGLSNEVAPLKSVANSIVKRL
ncbi:two-component system, chemotaxis family, response regulator CheB [Pseudobutyrivibrio sp. 49]|uniref:chemotaxis-specific protein-glutamate methyltransferase CheB n=1 Tax=Pseudobutyrivibrio sp. 49 TaxID=1855344 RepID=UPI0008908734|nr:chemotaxis-specific protein-glutamate methyltransferase CheB [Pseudobutyrivibrio sp. 49]SDH37826.1 two-component system, chemotaxis family, response regulator CheB [Pseudobutyrivibrio sp. 49]